MLHLGSSDMLNVECKYDADWVKRCMLMEIEGTRQMPEKDLVGMCQRRFGEFWPVP